MKNPQIAALPRAPPSDKVEILSTDDEHFYFTFVHLFSLWPRVQLITHFINVCPNSNTNNFHQNFSKKIEILKVSTDDLHNFFGNMPKKMFFFKVK